MHLVKPANRRSHLSTGGLRLQWPALQHPSFTDFDTTLLLRAISTMFIFERGYSCVTAQGLRPGSQDCPDGPVHPACGSCGAADVNLHS